MTFASACVPTADLSSYSSAASNATADLGEHTPPPTRPPMTARPDEETPDPTLDDPTPGESVAGSDAPLDRGETGDPPSGSVSGEDDSETAIDGTADAGPRPEAGPPPIVPPPIVPPPPDPEPPRPLACTPEEKTGPNGHCYVLVATLLDWDAARANCQARGVGWNLTSIRSATDSTFLSSFLDEETWVGGSDAVTEATWAWVDDGFQFWQGEGSEGQPLNGAFINWFDDEPNGSSSSDCMRLLIDSRWADLECAEFRPSVCEGPPG